MSEKESGKKNAIVFTNSKQGTQSTLSELQKTYSCDKQAIIAQQNARRFPCVFLTTNLTTHTTTNSYIHKVRGRDGKERKKERKEKKEREEEGKGNKERKRMSREINLVCIHFFIYEQRTPKRMRQISSTWRLFLTHCQE